ncbi:MAG: agmatine deiminase family protein [Oligoflexales bacterium]
MVYKSNRILRLNICFNLLLCGSFLGSGCQTKAKQSAALDDQTAGNPRGMVDERYPTGAVVISTVDSFRPLLSFQDQLLANLPPDVSAYLILPFGNPFAQRHQASFDSGRFQALEMPNKSNWTRDYFPEVVVGQDGSAKLVQFQYQHQDGQHARAIGERFASLLGLPLVTSNLILEGGNLMVDSTTRVLFVTEKIISANASLTQGQIEAELKSVLEVDYVEWLPVLPKETTGHIDIFAKIVANATVIVSDSLNPNRKPMLDQVARRFEEIGYRVSRVLNAEEAQDNARTKSYTNSLLVNNIAFVPSYYWPDYHEDGITPPEEGQRARAADAAAKEAYQMAGYQVVQIPTLTMTDFGGAIHCLTKQIWNGVPRLHQ